MLLTGAEIFVQCLLEQEVDTVFGFPGGTILNIYDELYKCGKIRHIRTAHEQGASHAADGYARSTGKVGVCLATSGPGATNLTTGMATAMLDSSPVVFVSCNVAGRMMGKDAFQEVDITGIALPITKSTFLVKDPADIADAVRQAFALARSGRPGPVLNDITTDATKSKAEYEFVPRKQHAKTGPLSELIQRSTTSSLRTPEPDRGDVDKLVDMIAEAKKPMLICGGGVVRSRGHEEFLEFARKMDAPVAITVMGGGGIYGLDPLVTGMIGMHGSKASNMAVDECDLLIAVGCRFSDRVTLDVNSFARKAKIVHIDIDRAEINKNVMTDHHIIGDAKHVLHMLNERIPQYDHTDWKEYVFSFPRETVYDDVKDYLTPKQILQTMSDMCPEETIVSTDVGQHQMWAIQHLHFSYPGQLLTSGGFGAMGFGLGAAIGAKVGNPDTTVIHVTSDGSFRMNCNELTTEALYKTPVITFIFNNQRLGMVYQWQQLIYGQRYSETITEQSPDFVKLAEAYGIGARRVASVEELKDALNEAFEYEKKGIGFVIDCAVRADELVRPMVQNGKPITDFLIN